MTGGALPAESGAVDAGLSPRTAVVIPVKDHAPELLRALRSIVASPPDLIVVVDDGSSDGSATVARQLFAQSNIAAKVIVQPNRGAAAARNAGARAAIGAGAELLLFLDADCEAAPGWASIFGDHLRAGGADVVGGAIRPREAVTARQAALQAMGGAHHRIRDGRVQYLVSANLGMRAEVFVLLGGFDERAGTCFAEDADLSFRAAGLGLALEYLPDAAVVHDDRQSLRALWSAGQRSGRGSFRLSGSWRPHRQPAVEVVRHLGGLVLAPWRGRTHGFWGVAALAVSHLAFLHGMALGVVFDRRVRGDPPQLSAPPPAGSECVLG